ncbi:MAG: nucleotide sugar dehydrogenase [Rhodospirillaceae bacterium]|nr:nucleotide sugar dehydrogenase [Rhodospirillaceae bacterium]MYB14098.1 nucleotide sugar dehydrogenase [Rhodospirillaceae bacterium]MYI48129.1 nucleotide sugar dehydrogenase [Rhodospirillaceae bacterium]
MELPDRIAVIGLGYVGLPLAVALARHFDVVGIDRDAGRIAALRAGRDATREVPDEALAATSARFSADPAAMAGAGLFIVAVPTPVDARNAPDLGAVRSAMEAVGGHLRPGATVVLESTVYPGATEEVCRPILERASGLAAGADFFLGYSPERANPGDRAHGLAALTKVVAGETSGVAAMLAAVYGKVTGGNVFVARDIRTAEAAKAIENAQRDINIAFVNEVAMICNRLGLSVYDVLDAARTKWNFLPFAPGLVGGHCIGVDPYWLAHRARAAGHDPEIVLAGRRINDGMGGFVAQAIDAALDGPSDILVLGLAFKENVPDLRNTGAAAIVRALEGAGHTVHVHDAFADPGEAQREHGIALVPDLGGGPYDAVVGAVMHDPYRDLGPADFSRLLRAGGLLADIKGMWRGLALPDTLRRWSL